MLTAVYDSSLIFFRVLRLRGFFRRCRWRSLSELEAEDDEDEDEDHEFVDECLDSSDDTRSLRCSFLFRFFLRLSFR